MPALSSDVQQKKPLCTNLLKLGASAATAYCLLWSSAHSLPCGVQGLIDTAKGDTVTRCDVAPTGFAFRCYDRVYGKNSEIPAEYASVYTAFGTITGALGAATVISCGTQAKNLK